MELIIIPHSSLLYYLNFNKMNSFGEKVIAINLIVITSHKYLVCNQLNLGSVLVMCWTCSRGLTHFPPKFAKKNVPVITFFPFLLCK